MGSNKKKENEVLVDTETGAVLKNEENVSLSSETENGNFDILKEPLSGTIIVNEAKAEKKKSVYVYLGPSIRGVVANGSIFGGDKAEIVKSVETLANAAGIGDKVSKIERLIVADVNVSRVKEQLRSGENVYSRAYREIYEEEL